MFNLPKNTKSIFFLKHTRVYLSLGSNLDEKLKHLQNAINAIHNQVGNIAEISSVYQTPAWGFDGNDFYNICIGVDTFLCPEKLLEKLLEIEKTLGRTRNKEVNAYQNRSIDIDVIFYGNILVDEPRLTIPHPRLTARKFVLFPLAEIAPNFIHPSLNKSIEVLKETTKDVSLISKVPQKLNKPLLPDNPYNYLVIEGAIGVGKTSLSTLAAQDYNTALVLERYKDNPFLPKFYKNQSRYAFPLEMSFLADRYQQLIDDIAQYKIFTDNVIADYDIYKSLIFAKITLAPEEFALYKKLFNIMYKDVAKPDMYVYLYQNTERLLENIKKRGRSYEQDIRGQYLEKINEGYLSFIKNQHYFPIKIIDVSELDFIANREDYLKLLETIFN